MHADSKLWLLPATRRPYGQSLNATAPQPKVQPILGPAHKALGNRISKEIAKALASPEVHARLDGLQPLAVGSTPEEFEQLVRKDMQSMARLAEGTGLSGE